MKKELHPTSICSVLCGALCLAWLSSGRAGLHAENSLSVGDATVKAGETAEISLELSGDSDVQGFVLVFEWDGSKAKGVEVTPNDGAGKPLAGADLIEKRLENDFIILAAVLDIDGKDGEKIPAGNGNVIGTAKISCDGPTSGTEKVALKLVDNKYARVDGGPLLSNLISIGGRSIGKGEGLRLNNGTLTCEGEEEPTPTGKIMFACGGSLDSDGNPKTIHGARDSTHAVTFYYKAPGSKDKIQGLSMAVMYSCDLNVDEDSLDMDGGALEDLKPEFVNLQVDNDPVKEDKDGCEFTLGLLIDAKSPFDGRTLPTTSKFKKLFNVDFQIEDDADCGKCYWVKFMDGLNGNGTPPVKNLVSINFRSQSPQLKHCQICVDGGTDRFVRGDCNMSGGGRSAVDISDAAAMVGYFFFKGNAQFKAPCDDACDANDDGRLDASDVVYILNYMFVPKSPKPPAPGPTSSGSDPTKDSLGCDGGTNNDC